MYVEQLNENKNKDKDENNSENRQNAYAKNAIGIKNAFISMISKHQQDGKKILRFASDLTKNLKNQKEKRQSKIFLNNILSKNIII